MKKLLLALLSLAAMSSFMACGDDNDEVTVDGIAVVGRQLSEASVTYTVPLYMPSLEWLDYIISYTVPNGTTSTDTVSYENVNSGKVPLVALADKDQAVREQRAFWVRNGHFTAIPDSCCIQVRMRYRANVEIPGRIDLIVPQPAMTAVVRDAKGNVSSTIGDGLDCNVISVETGTDVFRGIYEGVYSSTCTFYPSVRITSNRTHL